MNLKYQSVPNADKVGPGGGVKITENFTDVIKNGSSLTHIKDERLFGFVLQGCRQ